MDRIRYVARSLGMEIPLCLYMITSFLKYPVFQNLIYEKLCLGRYDNNFTLCENVDLIYKDHSIQKDANHFYSLSSYTLMFPSLVATMLLGAVSDIWSVKIPLLIPFFGLCLGTFNYIFQTVYMETNIHYLLISDAVFGICGGYTAIISTTLSYGVKRSVDRKRRSYRIAGLEGAIGLGGTIGYALSGTIRQWVKLSAGKNTANLNDTEYRAFGYAYAFLLMLVLQTFCFYYIMAFAKEKKPNQQAAPVTTNLISGVWAILSGFYNLLRKSRPTQWIMILNLVAFGFELLIFSGLNDIQFSYLRYKLAWTDKQYGWFSGLSFGLSTFAVLTFYPLMRYRGISDALLACLGIILKIFSLFMFAFLVNPAMAYSITVITSFNRFVSSGFRAFLSSMVSTEEQGQLFSLIGIEDGITSLVATSIYNNVYPETLNFFPGLCYVASAALLLPSLVILIYSDVITKRQGLLLAIADED